MILDFPEGPLEFNRDQFIWFSKLMLLFNNKKITFAQFKVRLTYAFLNMRRSAKWSPDLENPVIENVMRISNLADAYFTDKVEGDKVIKIVKMQHYKQHLPVLKIGGRRFYGPDDAIFNSVYGEFIQATNEFTDYSKTGDESHLDRMIATLYRPAKRFSWLRKQLPGYKGDKRRQFNPHLTERYAKRLAKLPAHLKYAVYLFFASSQ